MPDGFSSLDEDADNGGTSRPNSARTSARRSAYAAPVLHDDPKEAETTVVSRPPTSGDVSKYDAAELAVALARKAVPRKIVARGSSALANSLRAIKASAQSTARRMGIGGKTTKVAMSNSVVKMREMLDARQARQLEATQKSIDAKTKKLEENKTARQQKRDEDEASIKRKREKHEDRKSEVTQGNARRKAEADEKTRVAEEEKAIKKQAKIDEKDAQAFRNKRDAARGRAGEQPAAEPTTKAKLRAASQALALASAEAKIAQMQEKQEKIARKKAEREAYVRAAGATAGGTASTAAAAAGALGVQGHALVLHTRGTGVGHQAWPPVQKIIDDLIKAASALDMKLTTQILKVQALPENNQAYPFVNAMREVHDQEVRTTDLIQSNSFVEADIALRRLKDLLGQAVVYFEKYERSSTAVSNTVQNSLKKWTEPLSKYISFVQAQNVQGRSHVSGTQQGEEPFTRGSAASLSVMQGVLDAW